MTKFLWTALLVVALFILVVINIKEVPVWVVVADVVLGAGAAFAAFKLGKFPVKKTK